MSEFDRALPLVLMHEGGYVNHPKDPGGETNKGITKRVYDEFRRARHQSPSSVRNISNDEVAAIYRERYWNLFKGDEMPAGVGYVVFDGAVNSGVGQSVKWLQRALGPFYKGAVDGISGPGTIAAIRQHPNHDALIAEICKQRLAFLKALKTWGTFGKGWERRVKDVQKAGQAWASGPTSPPMPLMATENSAKAPVTDAAEAPPVAPGNSVASGGTATAVISQALGQLQPLQAIPSVQNIIMWLTIASVVLALGGIAYGFWARRRKAEIKKATA